MVLNITEQNLQSSVLEAQLPVLLHFWMEDCGPCKALEPMLDTLAKDFEGKVVVAKINLSKHQLLAQKFGVSSAPTVMIVVEGDAVDGLMGPATEYELRQMLELHIEEE